MAQSEPRWWYADARSPEALLLAPLGWIYGAAGRARFATTPPMRSERPVICIGNFTAGGAGKTPLTIAVAAILRSLGREPWTLSRGYGGALAGPVRVDPARHGAADVGDEPLLLAKHAVAVVSRDRRAGARFIAENAPANAVIVMDDGLQNPALRKDLTLVIVDRARGLGNGRVIPAGPLRAPLGFQVGLADALVVNGPLELPMRADVAALAKTIAGPMLSVWPTPADDEPRWRGRRVVAYAGIANPQRFFLLLENLGAHVVETRAFGDHQSLTNSEAQSLLAESRAKNATLVTTEKDMARFTGAEGAVADLAQASEMLKIRMQFGPGDEATLKTLIARAIETR